MFGVELVELCLRLCGLRPVICKRTFSLKSEVMRSLVLIVTLAIRSLSLMGI